MKKYLPTFFVLLFLFSGIYPANALSQHAQQTVPNVKIIAADYPKVDGSTSAHPLQVYIACRIHGVPCDWRPAPLDRERRIVPDKSATKEMRKKVDILHTGTNPSYINLIKGAKDLILVARAPSEDELREAKKAGVELDVRAVALDAFVVIVNVKNPVENITLDQLRGIYTGKIKNWQELGGVPGDIRAYRRERNSGSQELMEALVMKGTPMANLPNMMLMSMMGPVNALRHNPSGIGYSVYFYFVFMFPEKNIRMIAINGVKPDAGTIGARTYPLTAEVYAVVRKGMPADNPAVMLRDWMLTKEGRAVIAETGYVPVGRQ